MRHNIVIDTDAYKVSQWLQYPPGMTNNFSYFESRGGDYPSTLFFGLQYILKEYFAVPVTMMDVLHGECFWRGMGLPFNVEGWTHIVQEHNGRIPVRIRAVPEGTIVPFRNALFTVESTCPKVPWITSWVETALARVWYPITVATRSKSVKERIEWHHELTSDEPLESINFKLHDFGSRGGTSQESAQIGGMAHLVCFLGTDTGVGVQGAQDYYGAEDAGFSIPASEHSTMTSWGKEREVDAFRNMLEQFGGKGNVFACVSDSYDIYKAVDDLWGGELRQEVIDSGSTVVIRPDSGPPVGIVMDLLVRLESAFGSRTNRKDFKVLNNVRIIQGDGIGPHDVDEILVRMYKGRWSVDNVAFGMGAGLIQRLDRDTCQFAFKCSEVVVNGQHRDVLKDPVHPGKKSKTGRVDLIRTDGQLSTTRIWWNQKAAAGTAMETVYEDGRLLVDQTFAEIKGRLQGQSSVQPEAFELALTDS